jgi:hypothetical protein
MGMTRQTVRQATAAFETKTVSITRHLQLGGDGFVFKRCHLLRV